MIEFFFTSTIHIQCTQCPQFLMSTSLFCYLTVVDRLESSCYSVLRSCQFKGMFGVDFGELSQINFKKSPCLEATPRGGRTLYGPVLYVRLIDFFYKNVEILQAFPNIFQKQLILDSPVLVYKHISKSRKRQETFD